MSSTRRGSFSRGIAIFIVPLLAMGGILIGAPPAQAASPVVVSLTFNDGLATQYRNARPVLRAHGMHGSFYVASNWVKSNDAKYMRYYQLDDLYREGDEIGGMGKDHKNLTTTYDPDPAADLAYKRDQVCGDFQALDTWGYHPVSFAYPGAAENTSAQGLVRDCGFTTGRVAGGLSASGPVYAEPIPPTNAYRLRVGTTPAGPITLQALQNLVTAAGAHGGGWLPIAFNDVCSSVDSTYATCMNGNKPIDASVLSAFLDWVAGQASGGVSVSTVRQVMGSEQPPLPPRPFVVSLTFDDGLRSQYGLLDLFARHHALGSFYINSGPADAGEAGTMTWAQIRALQSAGHDVGGHTTDHINMLDSSTSLEFKTRQVCDDRKRLMEEGIRAVSFAYPFGAMDATAQPIVRGCGYQSARKAGTVTSDGPIFSETIPVTENPYAIRILGTNYNGPVTLEALQYAVNQAIAHGGQWLPTLFHQICYAGTAGYDSCMAGYRPIDDLTIDAFLGWIESQSDRNISVKTVADVMGGGSASPLVAVTGPANASKVQSGSPELTGTADGNGNVSVRVYNGDYSTGTPVTTLTAQVANGRWTVQPGQALADGAYTVQASQTSGNATGTSLPVRFTVDSTLAPTDTTAPVVAVSEPSADSTVTTPTPTVAGTGGTAQGDGANVTLKVYEGSASTGPAVQTATADVAAAGGWSTALSALGDGTYTVVASQSDQTGNIGTSAPVTFTINTTPVDTTAPTVLINSPNDGDTVDTEAPVISGSAGTAAGDAATVTVTVTPTSSTGGDEVQTLTESVSSGGSWSATPAALGDGSYTVVASQSDQNGNIGTSAPVTFTIDTTVDDTTAPTVVINSPDDGDTVDTEAPVISGSAGTAAEDAAAVTVTVTPSSSTGAVQTLTGSIAADGSWSVTPAALAEGSYSAVATQADASGNIGTSAAVTFTVNATGPAVSITSPADGANVTSSSLTVSGSAGTEPGDESTVTLAVYAGSTASGTPASQVTADRSSGAWSAGLTGLTPGSYTLRATQRDASGKLGTSADVHVAVRSSMTATSVTPASVGQGATGAVLTVDGTGFQPGASAAVSGAGVTVTGTVVQSSTRLSVTVDVASAAAIGARAVTVSANGTFDATCSACVSVTAAPRPTQATPASLGQGATTQVVRVSGTGFTSGATASVSGTGVSSQVTSVSATVVTLSVSVDTTATPGARNVTIVNGNGGRGTCVGCFTVLAGPKITSVAPVTVRRNASTTVTVNGTGFDSSLKVDVSGTGVTAGSFKLVSPTRFTVVLKVNNNAALGARSLTLTSTSTKGMSTTPNAISVVT